MGPKKRRTNKGHLLNVGLLWLIPWGAVVVPPPRVVVPIPVTVAVSVSLTVAFALAVPFAFSVFASAGLTPFDLSVNI